MRVHPGYTAVPAVAGALAALLVPRHGRAVFVSGMLTGLTALFRHDFGAYLAVAMVLAVSIRRDAVGRTIAVDSSVTFAEWLRSFCRPTARSHGKRASARSPNS